MLETLGKKLSWAQFLLQEAVLHRALRQDPRAGLGIFKTAPKNARYFKMYFSISLVLGRGKLNRGSQKITKNNLPFSEKIGCFPGMPVRFPIKLASNQGIF